LGQEHSRDSRGVKIELARMGEIIPKTRLRSGVFATGIFRLDFPEFLAGHNKKTREFFIAGWIDTRIFLK
jgi:hypothetical protein